MADSEYIIEMKHITKRFPGIVANDDVSLSIKRVKYMPYAAPSSC